MTRSREKVRAVFLTAMLVLSVVAMGTAGFAGIAAANASINEETEITTNPQTVVDNDITTVDVTVGDGDLEGAVEYNVTADGDSISVGTTDGTFSFTADPIGDDLNASENYTVTVNPGEDAASTTVDVVPPINVDFELDEDPAYGDSFVVSGSVANNGDFDYSEFGQLDIVSGSTDVDPDNATTLAEDLRVLSDGTINDVEVDANDAGNFTFVYEDAEGERFLVEDATFSIASQEGDLTIEANETPTAGDGQLEEYNVSFVDANGDGISLNESPLEGEYRGYLNVTGLNATEFEDSDIDEGEFVEKNTDGDYFHATTDDGALNFTAEALNASTGVTVTPEVEGDEVYSGGVENNDSATFDTLDIVADGDSVDVEPGANLNVALSDDELSVGDEELTVEVTGVDFDPVGDDNDDGLTSANVTVSSDNIDSVEEQTIELTEGADSDGHATFENLTLEQAGDLIIDVDATDGDVDDPYTTTETVPVDGDILVDVSPDEVTSDEETNINVQLTDADGNDVPNRNLNLTGSALSDSIEVDSGALVDLGPSTYEFENVEFDSPGSINLTVEDDDENTTLNATDVITVSGDERFELQTDDELLTTAEENVTFDVYNLEDEAIENDSDTFDDLVTNFELTQDGEEVSTGDVTPDAENGTILVEDVLVDDTGVVNASSQAGDALEANGEISVVEPEITTDLADDEVLTEGVTTDDITVTVTDPRDGSSVNGSVQFTANGTGFAVGDAVLNDEGATTDNLEDGETTVSVTPNETTDAESTTLEISAQVEEEGWFGEAEIGVGDLQLVERENGDDADLRDEIEFDSEDEVVFLVRDANGDRVTDVGDVNLTGNWHADGDATVTTDEGFFTVDFGEYDLTEDETIVFDVDTDDTEEDITAATIDVTEDLEEVELTLTANETDIEVNDTVDFDLVRGDFMEETAGELVIYNESEEEYDRVDRESATDELTYEFDEEGTYEVVGTKDDSTSSDKTFLNDTVTITVGDTEPEPPEPPQAQLELTVTEDPVDVDAGDDITAAVDIENTGPDAFEGTLPLALELDGETGDSTTVSDIDANTTETVEFSADSSDLDGEVDWSLTADGTELSNNGSGTITVTADEPPAEANFTVSDLEDTEIEVGEEIESVSADVTNGGDAAGETDVELLIDGETQTTQTVELDADATETVTFENVDTSDLEAGEYDLTVSADDSETTATLTVTEAEPEPPQAELHLSVTDEPVDVDAGDDITAAVDVHNAGPDAFEGSFDLALELDGEVVASETVSDIDADDTETVSLSADSSELSGDVEWTLTAAGQEFSDNGSGTITVSDDGDLPVDEDVYDAVASLGADEDQVTGSDLTQFRGSLIDGESEINGVEVSGADFSQLRGHLLDS